MTLQKWRDVQSLTIFNTFSLQHLLNNKCYGIRWYHFPKLVWIYQNYYQLPKSHICNTSCIEIDTFFVIFNNGGLVNSEWLLILKNKLLRNWVQKCDIGLKWVKFFCKSQKLRKVVTIYKINELVLSKT